MLPTAGVLEKIRFRPQALSLAIVSDCNANSHTQSMSMKDSARDPINLRSFDGCDFDSKYTVEAVDASQTRERFDLSPALGSDNIDHRCVAYHPGLDGTTSKTRTAPIVITEKSSARRTARLSCSGQTEIEMPQRSSECRSIPQCGALTCKERGSWFSVHFKVILALYAISHFGIILLTISIVLCTQDTKTGKTREGTVISGVVGLASIICSFFAGYDLLLAEYPIDRGNVRHGFHGRYTEGVLTEQSQLHEGIKRVLINFKEDDHLDRVSYPPSSPDKVDAAELPQNDSSRLPNPFSSTDPSLCKKAPSSRPPHMPPGEVYKQIREIRRLVQLPATATQPPQDPLLRWSAELDCGTDTEAQSTSQNRSLNPERRALSNVRIQHLSRALSCRADVEEFEKPCEGDLQGSETDDHDRLSSATSRRNLPGPYHSEGLHQITVSPLTSPLEINRISHTPTPEVIIRISAVPSLIPAHQIPPESNPLMTLWRQYVAKSSVDLSSPSSRTSYNWASRPRQPSAVDQWRVMSCIDTGGSKSGDESTDKPSDRYKPWSQAFSTLSFQSGEGGLAFSGV